MTHVELLPRARADGAAPRRDPAARCELYRLLADPVRTRLLALAAHEELGVSELAELLREGQPKISRHASALRDAGVLDARRHGAWSLLRLAPRAQEDPVVSDAVAVGRAACELDGTLARVEAVVARRDAATREFFARGGRPVSFGPPSEAAAYLAALAPLLPRRALAVDAGTGDGALLEVLAPVFDRVIAVDRSEAQLALAHERVSRRGFGNVELVHGEADGDEAKRTVARAAKRAGQAGADAVLALRVLHHAPLPARALAALAELARPAEPSSRGGAVIVVDYEPHDDEAFRAQQADLWTGFDRDELDAWAALAGLEERTLRSLPPAWQGEGVDRHLRWQVLVGFRTSSINTSRAPSEPTRELPAAREQRATTPPKTKGRARSKVLRDGSSQR